MKRDIYPRQLTRSVNLLSDAFARFVLGVVIGVPLGATAYRLRYLDLGAAVASVLFSGLYFMGGLGVYVASLTFFFSSSIVTKLGYANKKGKGAAEREKGRSAAQVMGAGLVAALAAATHGTLQLMRERTLFSTLAVLAASNADTWAAEVGALYPREPRLITRPKVKVEPGTSGGVTPLGTLGALAGSSLIAGVSALLSISGLLALDITYVPAIAVMGWLGEAVDSIVGATLQAKYYCTRCGVLTDKVVHKCGEKTVKVGGLSRVTNEVTNLIATGCIAVLALLLPSR